jgi:hypothetical protein
MVGQRENADMLAWGGENARNQYGNALSFLQNQYGNAQNYLQPMTEYGKTGVDAYMAGMGLGPQGAEGMNNFQNTPGYQFARDQGLDAVNRTAAARGGLAGGNNTVDLMKYATGFADQTYGNYMSRLNPLMQMYQQGVGGQANAAMGLGQQGAGVYGNMARSYQDEAAGRGRALAGIGEANAGGIMGAANAQAGVINQGLNLAGSLFGMPSGVPGTSMGGDLYKRYVQGAVPAQWG